MLNESDLRELLNYSSTHNVLSLYLNTEPAQGNADAYRLRLRTMLKELDLPKDTERVEHYFSHEYDWSGRSVAVFSCTADDFFKAYPLSVPVRSRVRVSDHPHFKPLADLWDAYGSYGVVLVDKQGARLFHFNLGELKEQEGILGDEVKHAKRGGASSIPGTRGGSGGLSHNDDEIVDRNMKKSVEFANHFFETNHIRRVVIGGTEENTKTFRNLLPKAWQSLVVGTFSLPMTASHVEVLSKAMEIGKEAEEIRESKLIDTAITAAAKNKGGAVGLENTLAAVSSHRVQTLLFKEGLHSVGIRCRSCGFISAHNLENCPLCNSQTDRVLDVVDVAVRSVLQSGGDVEVVHNNPDLERVGKIAAVLRY
jgi:peptide subunit release factor 1 (eRF1)